MFYQSMIIDIKTKIRAYGDSLFVYENKYYLQTYLGNCAYIQALLFTVVFSQRFDFVTFCLVHYLREVPPWWTPKKTFLKFRSQDRWKMHFQHSLWLQKHSLHIVHKHDFFPWILWFGDKFTRNCITQVGPHGAGYKKLVPDTQGWP